MNALRFEDHHPPVVAIEKLIDEHGFRRILIAVLSLAVRRRASRPPDLMSDHLRRDIGLEPLVAPRATHWDPR